MPPVLAQNSDKLVIFGEFFFDFVFFDLPGLPRLGEEVKTKSFGIFPGGGLATTALVASRLGTPTAIITKVGSDALNSPVWQKLAQSGISTTGCQFDPHLPTAVTVCAAFDGDRMMITHDAINQNLVNLLLQNDVQKQILSAKHLHLACSLWPISRWTPIVHRLRRQGITLSADIGWNPEVFGSRRLPSLLKDFEFVLPNEAEAKAMTGERSVEAAAKRLRRWVPVPLIKLGQSGSLTVRNGKLERIRSIKVRAVDATGAGDAFNGGFLHGYLRGWPLEACMRAGNVCGALAASQPGGSSAAPTMGKLQALMRKIQ